VAIGHVRGNKATSDCCYQKVFENASYTIHESGSAEVDAYGCNTAGNCIYTSDKTGERFCFKMGGTEMPTCQNGPCGEGTDLFVTWSNEETLTAHALPDANCIPPTFNLPNFLTPRALYQCNNRLYTTIGSYNLRVLETDKYWVVVERPEDFTTPKQNGLATANDKLYMIGGLEKKKTGETYSEGSKDIWELDCVRHAKGDNSNGAAWKKLDIKQKYGLFGSIACAMGNKLITVEGYLHTESEFLKKVIIYDLSKTDGNALEADLPPDYEYSNSIGSLACLNNKVYFMYFNSDDYPKIAEYDLTATKLAPKDVIDSELDYIVALGGKLTAIGKTKTNEDYKNLKVLSDNGTWVDTQPFSLTAEFRGIIQGPVLYF